MKKRSENERNIEGLRDKIIGLGESSFRKTYYPQLQKKLADLERFKALLDQSNDIIFLMLVPSGEVVEANDSLGRQLGYGYDSLMGMSIYDLVDNVSEELEKFLAAKTGSLMIRALLRTKSGGKIPYEINMRVVRFGNKEYAVAVARDITQRIQVENELKEAKARAELYVDLMGHDINNMNQIVMGYLEMAQDKLMSTGTMSKDDLVLIDKPLEALKSNSMLIDNVRKLQREKSGELKLQAIDAGKVLEETIKKYSGIRGRDITIRYTPIPGCYVMANELLVDVFSNLIGNAIKHSTGSLSIDVKLEKISEYGKEYCAVTVEDNGPGMTDDLKKKLFDRLCLSNARTGGKGFGLCLIKLLLDDINGRFWVEDRIPGDYSKGCKFVVMLPAARDDSHDS